MKSKNFTNFSSSQRIFFECSRHHAYLAYIQWMHSHTKHVYSLHSRYFCKQKCKQSVWTRRGNIAAHHNAGAGVRVRRLCVPVPRSCAELYRAAPLSACPPHLSAVQQRAAVYSTLTSAFTTTPSGAFIVQWSRNKLRETLWILILLFGLFVDIFLGVFYLVCEQREIIQAPSLHSSLQYERRWIVFQPPHLKQPEPPCVVKARPIVCGPPRRGAVRAGQRFFVVSRRCPRLSQ